MHFEPLFRSHIVLLADRLRSVLGLRLSTIGRLIMNDPHFMAKVRNPRVGFTVRSYDRALAGFSWLWPTGMDWPEGIPRPPAQLVQRTNQETPIAEAAE